MRSGETGFLKISISGLSSEAFALVDEIIFSVKSGNNIVKKRYPSEVNYSAGYFYVPLTQEETTKLVGHYNAEAQINFTDKSVSKSSIESGKIAPTVDTEFVEGNAPSTTEYASFQLSVSPIQIISESGTSDYEELTNLPKVNNVELKGSKTAADLGLAPATHTHSASDVSGLSAVATSGSYNDLSGKPTIPTYTAGTGISIENNVISATGGGASIDDTATSASSTWSSSKISLDLADKKQVDANTSDIAKLYKLTQGQTWDFEEQTESGINVPPSGAVYESILSADGNTTQIKWNGYNLIDNTKMWTLDKEAVHTAIDTGFVFDYDGGDGQIQYNNGRSASYFFEPYLSAIGKKLKLTYDVENVSGTPNIGSLIEFDDGTVSYGISSRTITLEKDVKRIGLYVEAADWTSGLKVNIKNLMLEVFESGSTAHSYEPYVGGLPSPNPNYPQDFVGVTEININVGGETRKITPPFTLNKVGDYKDYLDVANGKWHREFYTQRITKNNFNLQSSNDVYNGFTCYGSCLDYTVSQPMVGKTNVFPIVSWGWTLVEPKMCFAKNSKYIFVCVPKTMFPTVADWNNYVANNEVIITYSALNEDIDIDADDLAWIHEHIYGADADKTIIITDQNGNDVSYLVEYIVKLGGATINE